jgi:hypothetical protein
VRFRRFLTRVAAVLVACALPGCGAQSSSSAGAPTIGSTTSTAAHRHAAPPGRRHRPAHRPAAHRPALPARPTTLPVSHAAPLVVQPQPAPGSCHAKGSGLFSAPDPACGPGALNAAVTQATIGSTICMSGYTKTVRPPEHITAKEKLASMAAYGDHGSPSDYEYDHIVSLELGGAANDPRNLWPEPGDSPNPKDSVENSLHRLVCSGQMPLAQAQKIIARGWIAYYRRHEQQNPTAPSSPAQSSPAQSSTPPSSSGPDSTAALRATTSPASTATTTAWPANRCPSDAARVGAPRHPRPGPRGWR